MGEDGRSLIEIRSGTAIITDAITGQQLAQVPGVDPATRFAYLSADRTTLATLACEDPANCNNDPKAVTVHTSGRVTGQVKLESASDYLAIQLVFDGHTLMRRRAVCGTSPVVAGTPDTGRLVACIAAPDTFGLAEAGTGKVVSSRHIEKGKTVRMAQLSPDGQLLATLWTWGVENPHGFPDEITGVDLWAVDGTRLTGRLARGEFPTYDSPRKGSGAGPCPAGRLAFSGSGTVLTAERCGLAMLWGNVFNKSSAAMSPYHAASWPESLVPLEPLARIELSAGSQLAFSTDDRLLTMIGDGELRVTEVGPYTRSASGLRHGPVRSAAFTPDGRILATMDERALRLVDVASGRELRTFTGSWISPLWSGQLDLHPTAAPITFSADGKLLAVNGEGVEAVLIDVATGAIRTKLTVPDQRGGKEKTGDIFAMDLSPDGSSLAMSTWGMNRDYSEERAIRVWDTATGSPTITIQNEIAFGLLYLPGGKKLLTAHPDQGICELDLDKRQSSCPVPKVGFRMAGYLTTNLGFSPDGTKVVLRMDDGSVVLWNPRTKQLVSPIMRGHTEGAVTSAAFAPDGRTLATGGQDNTVRLWDLTTGIAIGLPFRHNGDVLAVAFSRDGKSLHSVDAAGGVHTYPLDLARASRTVCAKAGRDLTPAERALYSVPTAGACPS